MRYTRLIIIACVLFALIAPLPAFAQQSKYYATVTGTVYNQALKQPGVSVSLYTYDPVSKVQVDKRASTTTDSKGEFTFDYVDFTVGSQFQYVVRADRGSSSALALVYALPSDNQSATPYVAPLNLDLSVPSLYSSVTVTVWSTAGQASGNANLVTVPGVKLTLFSLDPVSGNRTQILGSATTDSAGQHVYSSLPYGMYVVRAESAGQFGEQSFAAYQQVSTTSLSANLPLPSPTPTPGPSGQPTGSTGTPGFEAVAALIALMGAALYLRRA